MEMQKIRSIVFREFFDGNGHHLSNVMITSDTDAGLFRNLEGTGGKSAGGEW